MSDSVAVGGIRVVFSDQVPPDKALLIQPGRYEAIATPLGREILRVVKAPKILAVITGLSAGAGPTGGDR